MSLNSYRARVLAMGATAQDSAIKSAQMAGMDMLLNSPGRVDVVINYDEVNKVPCVPTDVDNYHIRKFNFIPGVKVWRGDYICHDGFVYLTTDQNTDKIALTVWAQECNFDFPIIIGEQEVQVGTKPNKEPIWETKYTYMVKPCVMTSKVYSAISNSSVNLAEGSMVVYLPYIEGEPLPRQNQEIDFENAQYKVVDFNYENVTLFNGKCRRGYIEVKLQRVMNTHDKS